MGRWSQHAGLARKYRNKPIHFVMANPFKFNEDVYPKVAENIEERRLNDLDNFTFHRSATHPFVSKRGATMVPGWNTSNTEVIANEQFACYVLFNRKGELVFQGRLSFDELEERVKHLLER